MPFPARRRRASPRIVRSHRPHAAGGRDDARSCPLPTGRRTGSGACIRRTFPKIPTSRKRPWRRAVPRSPTTKRCVVCIVAPPWTGTRVSRRTALPTIRRRILLGILSARRRPEPALAGFFYLPRNPVSRHAYEKTELGSVRTACRRRGCSRASAPSPGTGRSRRSGPRR